MAKEKTRDFPPAAVGGPPRVSSRGWSTPPPSPTGCESQGIKDYAHTCMEDREWEIHSVDLVPCCVPPAA